MRLVTSILLERLRAIWFFKQFFVSDDNLNMGMFKKITTVLSFAIAMLLSFSTQAAGMYTTYQAKIIKPDGTPLESTNVNFRFTILNPLGACILYAENFNTINMAGSGGLVNFSLGSGIKTFPVSGSVNFSDVFNNDGTALSCAAGGPPAYIPAANDLRKIVMQFHDGLGWQTLPAMNINHVPYAMYAKNSTQLNGKTDLDFVQVTSIPTCSASQALQFNGASFGCVAVGSSSTDGLLSVSGTAPVMVSGSASAPVISISVASMSSDGYLTAADYAEFKTKMSASSTEIANALGYAPVSSSAVATQITAQISAAAAVSNTANTLVLRDASGNIWANDVYANSTRTNYVDIFKPSTAFSIRLQAPTSLSASYNLIFPSDDGVSGQFLTTDGSGNLSWTSQTVTTISSSDVVSALGYTPANAASAGITTLNGSASATQSFANGVTGTTPAFVTVNGVHTLNIPLASAGSVTAGLISNSDYTTFANKMNATSSAIVSALGYTPAASGGISSQWVTSGTGISYSAGFVGIGHMNPVTTLDVSGGVRIGSENTACTSVLAGTLRFNAGNVEFCNGTVWSAFGVAGAGITGLNGSASGTQNFSSGIGGIAPNIQTLNGVHTFHIPYAASAAVTAGLLSNTDYQTFANKLNATSASVISALGYTPASSTALGNYLAITNNLSDLSSSASARTNLGLGGFATVSSLDLSSASATGILAEARLPSFANVTSGSQYTKVTVDGKGRVTSGAQLSLSDVTTALGYTPANAASTGVTTLNGSSSATQIFANGSTGSAPLFVTDNGVHTLNIPYASAGTTTAGLISNSDYLNFSNKITSSAASIAQVLGYVPASATSLGNYLVKANNLSDLTSSASARTNLGLGGFATVSSLDLGSASATGTIADARLINQSNVTSGSQYTKVTVDSKGRVTSGAQLSASDVATALGYTPQASGAVSSQWTTSGTTINYAGGNVGIGTVNPTTPLYVEGSQTLTGWLFMSGGHIVMNNDASIRFKNAANTENRDVMRMNSVNTLEITNNTDGNGGDIRFQTLGGGNESLRITSAGTVGIGTTTPVTKLSVSGGIQISMESAACATNYAGTLRYNSGNIEYCNGSTWSAFGVAGSGIISINGSTSSTQTFANGTTGTTPAFVTVNGMHTLNIPLASAGSVTAGLISNADYTTLMNKVSMTTLSNYVVKSNNLSDLTSSATARTNLGLGGFATVSSLDLGSASATGIISEARLMTFSGVTSGTQYTKVTVDSKGRVTSGSQVTLNDIVHVHTGNGGLFVGSGTSWPLVEDSNNSESTAFGVNSMAANQDSGQNTAFGFGTLESSVTSYENAAFGWYALQANTSGQFNTAIGAEALWNNTTGNENTAVGGAALSYNTTGYYNTAVGMVALGSNTSGTNNVGIGLSAGRANKTGRQNVYVGAGAGNGPTNNSNVSNTTIIGYEAATNISTGADNNIVIGAYSAGNLTTGANNIVIGNNINTVAATSSGTLNIGNLIFGTSLNGSGATVSTGNIGVGTKTPVTKLSVSGGVQISMESAVCAVSYAGTLRYNVGNVEFCNGSVWTAFGTGSVTSASVISAFGYTPADAANVTNLSSTVATSFTTSTNNINSVSSSVSSLATSTAASFAAIISSQWNTSGTTINYTNGFVGIGTTAPVTALHVVGDIQYTGTITDVSDRRLKTNIEPLDSALTTIRKIKTYSYVMKDDPRARTEYGVMAQDMLGIIPNLVKNIDTQGEYYGVNYMGLIPWSIRALQEVDSETQKLRHENSEIKRELSSLKEKNEVLEQKLEKILQVLEQQKHHGKKK